MLLFCATAGVSQTAFSTPDPKDSLAKADVLLNDGKAEEALALLHNVAANDPNLPGLEAALGKACFETRRFPQAIQHLSTALQQKPGDLETMQVLALTYYASGDYQQALPLLEKIGPNLPKTSADGPYLLGICYIMTQRWDDARKTFAQMFSVPPDSSMAYLMFGKILIRQRMEQHAIPEIEKALEMDPRLPMAHFLLGELALYKKDAQAAVNEFQKELAINPTVWLVYWRLGDAYVRLENYDEAEKVLKQAIWLNEWSSGAYILLGQIALKKDESGIAVGFLERALKLDPNNYWVHYFLAKAYHNVGRTAEATQHFEISKSLRNDQLADDRNMLQTVP
jgi:tetratricopeptide (TPR) repeat protein